MAGAAGTQRADLNALAPFVDTASRQEYFALLRLVDAASPGLPPLGRAPRPQQEAVRLSQLPALIFAPSEVAEVCSQPGSVPRIRSAGFGVYGPNGPLQLHLTEAAWDQLHNQQDDSLVAFADVFHQRLHSLFYRAWADSQPVISFDRDGHGAFTRMLGSLCGYGSETLSKRDAVSDAFKLLHAGFFARSVRSAGALQSLLGELFGVPVKVHEHVRGYIELEPSQWSQLSRDNVGLAHSVVLGKRVPDVQYGFEIEIGPLDRQQYELFAPDGFAMQALTALVHNWVGVEYRWQVKLLAHAATARPLQLGKGARLSFDGWARDLNVPRQTLQGATMVHRQ
ncbi:type VI secretion system protein ImpH [Andreprevotia lacus DSM 23236]|jgi:type VI secretion system protein ImpH|uniref:Type VI secretion system protein ImpH n=1 Tax=Andreprevotia lacus DSM 23236 TaxID=1121001 RepID=A0A1W1XMG7_9NEIS|nr:type VI secretion system baseplate subunit TssG [Andreprevotia lacus]SMC25017.1 type VI secretion system protein ImpH [Andreprevotia lacus DSM 23236]